MSSYKVGDLASLFPSPPSNKSKTNLQSLFNDYHSKNKGAVKSNIKKKGKKTSENTTGAIPSSPSIKRKNISDDNTVNVNKRVKKLKSKNTEHEVGFIRTNKKQRAKQFEHKDVNNSEEQTENDTGKDLFFFDSERNSDIESSTSDHIDKSPKKQKMKKKGPKNFQTGDPNDIKEDNLESDDLSCTLFVGNLPMSASKKELQKLFRRFGALKNIRLRGAVASKTGMPKKVAEIKNKYHEGMQSLKAFVVYMNQESAENALSLNGTLLSNHHIRVDLATPKGEKILYDDNLSVFVGNLPFNVSDETVWSAFEEYGEVQAVRIIRDRDSGLGKGFGYVQFKNATGRNQALKTECLEINRRQIRIKPVDTNSQKKTPKESVKMIRSNVAMKRNNESGKKKSVKKLLKQGKRQHQNKKIARMLGNKMK